MKVQKKSSFTSLAPNYLEFTTMLAKRDKSLHKVTKKKRYTFKYLSGSSRSRTEAMDIDHKNDYVAREHEPRYSCDCTAEASFNPTPGTASTLNAFERYEAATGGNFDRATGLLSITSDQYSVLQSLDFHIGRKKSLVSRWPRSLNSKLDGPGDPDAIISPLPTLARALAEGLTLLINGYTFIQCFYSVLDGSHSCVGFGITPFTDATTN
ncbi:hypothetical protein BDR07DRAFT_1488118 [Suillus spraguei]|nr:hypothetical protein BDR07DRAFT_1488118 [Suillus spraguei]